MKLGINPNLTSPIFAFSDLRLMCTFQKSFSPSFQLKGDHISNTQFAAIVNLLHACRWLLQSVLRRVVGFLAFSRGKIS